MTIGSAIPTGCEIVATLEWAAAALLRTALNDVEGPQ
jgi:hypothetical protein